MAWSSCGLLPRTVQLKGCASGLKDPDEICDTAAVRDLAFGTKRGRAGEKAVEDCVTLTFIPSHASGRKTHGEHSKVASHLLDSAAVECSRLHSPPNGLRGLAMGEHNGYRPWESSILQFFNSSILQFFNCSIERSMLRAKKNEEEDLNGVFLV